MWMRGQSLTQDLVKKFWAKEVFFTFLATLFYTLQKKKKKS